MSVKLTVGIPLHAITALHEATDADEIIEQLSQMSSSCKVVAQYAHTLIAAAKALPDDTAALDNTS